MTPIKKSHKLDGVYYDIRGPVMNEAKRLEEEGHRVIKLNIGNPAPFGLNPPEEIVQDMIYNLPAASGYCDSKGLFSARKAVMQYCQQKHIHGVGIEDIFLGNGVSELIVMATQALLNNDDEVLIPAPDYPLWTAAVKLSGGTPIHYLSDEASDWYPDLEDIKRKISPRTRALVIINPNNPTGSVYPKEVLLELIEIARQNKLIVFSDEIYDKVIYDGVTHISTASLADDLVFITMNGLSKSYRVAGYRAGWMVISGNMRLAREYIEGLNMLASMRLCANVPGQNVIQTALGGYQSINDLCKPGGRLWQQRNLACDMLNDIPGVSCQKPKGAMYVFPKLDRSIYPVEDDQDLILELLRQEKVLLVQGTAFNWPEPDHLRIVFLPREDDLQTAITRLGHFLERYRNNEGYKRTQPSDD